MNWKPTILIWVALFTPLSLYNLFGTPIVLPTQSSKIVDSKVLHYNFSLNGPIHAEDNFSARVILNGPVSNFRLRAYADVSVNYESYGAYGAYSLWVSVAENGIFPTGTNQRMDFVITPPPPSGSGAALNGPLPDTVNPETFEHVVQGLNSISLNFTFFSQGINSTTYTPLHYGPGFFKLDIGPFIVSVTDLITTYTLDIVSELILGAVLFPFAHGVRMLIPKTGKVKSL